jgi:DNA-binding transcriptional ArsR family regulator
MKAPPPDAQTGQATPPDARTGQATPPDARTGQPSADHAALGAAACLFRGLSDPARVAILSHLALGEHRVVDLTAHLGLAQSTVSAHLACLRDCGLVQSRPQGRASIYSLSAEPELMALLAAAERLLAATGDAVVLCPTVGAAANP